MTMGSGTGENEEEREIIKLSETEKLITFFPSFPPCDLLAHISV
jgi:hypothetical protein